jgi:hypothetical protein
MWSLPLATANFPLPKLQVTDANGKVRPHAFTYKLAEIASRIHGLENLHYSGKPLMELVNAVMVTDLELRTISRLVPKAWWNLTLGQELTAPVILQYWH